MTRTRTGFAAVALFVALFAEAIAARPALADGANEASPKSPTKSPAGDATGKRDAPAATPQAKQAAPTPAAPPTAKQAAAAAGAPAAPKALARIDDIRFRRAGDGAEVAIALTGDAAVRLGQVTAAQAELVVDGAELAASLERKLDVSRLGGPVRAVSSFRDRRVPSRVRLIAELARPIAPTLDRASGVLRWRLAPAATLATRARIIPTPVVGGFGATSTPIAPQSVAQVPPQPGRARVYRGATINLEVKEAPIHDLMRLIADTGHVSIVIPDTINPRVTVRLQRVPWDQALEVILASHGLWYRREGNLYRVATRKELDAEDEAEAARREAAIKSEVPRPEIVPLNYASASDLRGKLEGMLSGRPGSKIEVDERSNSLIVNDIAGNREQIARLALSLDTQTPQISIEARIVEARSTFLRQLGVQWGGRALAGAAGGNATGLIFPSSIGIVGGNEDAQTNRTGVATPSDFAVNLPAATGSGEGGAIGLSLGSVAGNFNINLRLSALEDSGTVRIISAPKITVLNNKLAKISQGVSIPISVISASGTQTQFVQADLSLEVTPYVSQRDCAIAMNLKVTKNEPDFVNVGARGDPTILRKEATTSMLVSDGETSVLGGIYTRNSGLAYHKIPFFGDLPVFGWLFKSRRENDDRTEILVFITPKITNRALLRCQ
jgi:type IV pilus assembly protein PilQ